MPFGHGVSFAIGFCVSGAMLGDELWALFNRIVSPGGVEGNLP